MPSKQLIYKLRKKTPFNVYLTAYGSDFLKQNGLKIKPDTLLKVVDIVNFKDIGGIGCVLEYKNEIVMTSITYLKLPENLPFYEELTHYQTNRRKKLSM